jgi:DNA-binding transcriptional LysR family regulator
MLVRAGRRLVPTPHAIALRDRVRLLADEVHAVLRPAATDLDTSSLDLIFTIRAGGGFVNMLSTAVVEAISQAAPHVRLRFTPKLDGDPLLLREGHVDLEISKRSTASVCAGHLSETEFYDDLKIIDIPVLVMHGEDDQSCPFPTAGARY